MAIVKKYIAEIISIIHRIDKVYTIELKSCNKNSDTILVSFFHLSLDTFDPSEGWPESRCFSIQSTPEEDVIRFTYAVKGEFTKKMERNLKVGEQLSIKLPYGDLFTQNHNKENTVFISGGTGITPYLSLFNHKSFKEYINPVLYAGFRTTQLNFYSNELELAFHTNTQFNRKEIYQDTEGLIDIKEIANQHPNSSFFISGPPEMIKFFKSKLLEMNIYQDNILTDDWE